MKWHWIPPLVLLSAIVGCRSAAPTDESERPEPVPVMLVTAAPVIVAPVRSTLHALGTTVAAHHIIVRSPTNGRVYGIKLKDGDLVSQGQLIGYVVNREIEAARAGLEVARKMDPENSRALEDSIRRYDPGHGIPIVAPESGVVSHPPVTAGQMVGDLDPIAELVDPASIYVEASIPIDELHKVSAGMPATVTSGLNPGANFDARVNAIIANFDANSATAPVRLDFTSPQSIREVSAPVEVLIIVAQIPNALVIPASALFQDVGEGRFHVFVAGSDGLAHRVNITTGIRDGAMVQVTSGLSQGEHVITSGGYALSDGLRVRIAQGQQ